MNIARLIALGGIAVLGVSACSGDMTGPEPIRPSFISIANTPTGDPQGAAVLPTPSTNYRNYTFRSLKAPNGFAHVLFVDAAIGSVTLNFVQPRAFFACFEYRVDDAPPASATNFNTAVLDGLWPYFCLSTISQRPEVFIAESHVDVRMVFGGERDERFDWTRFYVLPPPPQPATKDDCKNGGWQTLFRADGSPFKNQGDCVSYVNTGK